MGRISVTQYSLLLSPLSYCLLPRTKREIPFLPRDLNQRISANAHCQELSTVSDPELCVLVPCPAPPRWVLEGIEVSLTHCWELPRLSSTTGGSWKCWAQEAGTCAWEEKGRGFVDTAAGGDTVGSLPQGFLTCRAPKQKAAGLRQTRWPQSILWPKATSSCLPGPAAGSQW